MGGTSENAYFFVILPFRYHLVLLITLSSALLLPLLIPCLLLLHLSLFSPFLPFQQNYEWQERTEHTHTHSLAHTQAHTALTQLLLFQGSFVCPSPSFHH